MTWLGRRSKNCHSGQYSTNKKIANIRMVRLLLYWTDNRLIHLRKSIQVALDHMLKQNGIMVTSHRWRRFNVYLFFHWGWGTNRCDLLLSLFFFFL
uniref:Uncharacterized protein n=1 Tax=Rhizophora mucronata TaxID=61149 RepID=A0A2P2IUH5_RHIMU